jgi:hypothetical protein
MLLIEALNGDVPLRGGLAAGIEACLGERDRVLRRDTFVPPYYFFTAARICFWFFRILVERRLILLDRTLVGRDDLLIFHDGGLLAEMAV